MTPLILANNSYLKQLQIENLYISTCNFRATCGTVSQAEEAVMTTIFQFGHQMQPTRDSVIGSSWLLLSTAGK
jgi:hypothetical protein